MRGGCIMYVFCDKILSFSDAKLLGDSKSISQYITSDNISIYVDVWCSLNGRLQQRMYDPNYDLLQAEWSVFEQAEWLLPLLSEYNDYRPTISGIQEHVYSWSNYTDVLFIADFPGECLCKCFKLCRNLLMLYLYLLVLMSTKCCLPVV